VCVYIYILFECVWLILLLSNCFCMMSKPPHIVAILKYSFTILATYSSVCVSHRSVDCCLFYCRCRRCQCISIRVENAVVCAMKIKNKTTFSFGCLPLLVQRQQIFVFEFEAACCLNQSLHVQRLANLSVEFQYHNNVFHRRFQNIILT